MLKGPQSKQPLPLHLASSPNVGPRSADLRNAWLGSGAVRASRPFFPPCDPSLLAGCHGFSAPPAPAVAATASHVSLGSGSRGCRNAAWTNGLCSTIPIPKDDHPFSYFNGHRKTRVDPIFGQTHWGTKVFLANMGWGGVGWGGMLTFMWRWWCYAARGDWGGARGGGMLTFMLRWWCYAARGGWSGARGGGMLYNVHVTLMMLRFSWGLGSGGVGC